MHPLLEKIIQNKCQEAARLKMSPRMYKGQGFKRALQKKDLSIIGEVKRHSPSKGKLADIFTVEPLLERYELGGIDALSVLTDVFFKGSIQDLIIAKRYFTQKPIPVLRKDFIVDPIQIYESIEIGADAILLIVAVLQEKTQTFLDIAKSLHMDAIVEVHSEAELDTALQAGAEIIGINNRNLHTFEEDKTLALRLLPHIPDSVLTVAESAMQTPEDVHVVAEAGFDAVLMGEALVRSNNPAALIREMKHAD